MWQPLKANFMSLCQRYEVLKELKMLIVVFWDMTLCTIVDSHQSLEGTDRLHL
jgi:hypothetical protein